MITQEYLKECLEYNSETGVFIWKERPRDHFKDPRNMTRFNNRFAGKEAGKINKGDRYKFLMINYKRYSCHRMAWLYVYGYHPVNCVDHINGIRDDNRIINLREADDFINHQNQRRAHITNKSGLFGAQTSGSRYRVRIRVNGKYVNYGTYDTAEEANRVYIEIKRKVHPGCTI